MKPMNRRSFLKKSAAGSVGMIAGAPAAARGLMKNSPNDRLNVAVIGISGKRSHIKIQGRGQVHYKNYAKIPNVRVAAVCDVDERLWAVAVKEVEELYGAKPKTEVDIRKILEDRDIDIISIATPDHWHALHTIWACQAGKDVYVEKPVCHNVSEGRRMVEAARKYNRVVQTGLVPRSSELTQEGVKFIQDGKLGDVYMAKGLVYYHRESIGHKKDGPVPDGLNWDMFLGPAPYRPFNENRFIYNWHWFWDTGTAEIGNNGVYQLDIARWALNKRIHPVKIHCTGGFYGQDSDQEVPNVMAATFEYDDGKIIQCEIRSLFTNPEGGQTGGCFFYSSEGWMHMRNGFKTYFGKKNEPGPYMPLENTPRRGGSNTHWQNFIDCVRSGRWQDLNVEMLEGYMSTALCNLAIISYRTGRKLIFNPYSEKFIDDDEANAYLTRHYRPPYVMPDEV